MASPFVPLPCSSAPSNNHPVPPLISSEYPHPAHSASVTPNLSNSRSPSPSLPTSFHSTPPNTSSSDWTQTLARYYFLRSLLPSCTYLLTAPSTFASSLASIPRTYITYSVPVSDGLIYFRTLGEERVFLLPYDGDVPLRELEGVVREMERESWSSGVARKWIINSPVYEERIGDVLKVTVGQRAKVEEKKYYTMEFSPAGSRIGDDDADDKEILKRAGVELAGEFVVDKPVGSKWELRTPDRDTVGEIKVFLDGEDGEDGRRAYIADLWVGTEWRRKGLAGVLMRAVKRRFSGEGCIGWTVEAGNEGAKRFYGSGGILGRVVNEFWVWNVEEKEKENDIEEKGRR